MFHLQGGCAADLLACGFIRYHLKIIGHSLGGGAGSLLCYMINHDPILLSELGGMNAECFGIATPPVLSKDIAYQCEDHTTTLVMEVGNLDLRIYEVRD